MSFQKPIFFYDNLLKKYPVTVTSEAVGFPKERLFDGYMQKVWKATSGANQFITINPGVSLSVDCFFLGNVHNLATVGASISLQYSNDNFAADINNAFTNLNPATDNSYQYRLFTPVVGTYDWRIQIGGGMSAAPQIGEVAFGARFTLPGWFSVPPDRERHIEGSMNVSDGGQEEDITHYRRNVFPCRVEDIMINTQEEADMLAWRDYVEDGTPFWFLRDVSGSYEPYFVSIIARKHKAPISKLGERVFNFILREQM